MNHFGRDILQGMREGTLVFFAPIIAIWRLFDSTTQDLLRESDAKRRRRMLARR